MKTIDVKTLAEKQREGEVDLIDVRTPVEFREIHADGARNYPLDSLDPKRVLEARNGRSAEPLYVICRSGNRSSMGVKKFLDAGFDNVVNVDGGTSAWEQAGLPVQRGKKAISLERQVRIVAGFLVLLGAVLGFFVNSYFIALSAFIGAGLMFAGITDTCGMGMMLAKMPWNQCCDDTGTCAS
ncbi:rhodanese-like domain-containing protein [Roseiconus nitratireducens]|uniref:Rhodanese-like domain-containing protein n=1 Tax=Roseiconus nitratireducens TaxID=2605748 RepID=A0A5M6D368_9BACT|nr:rhodanese-like domain-containing protein [Roseiconus nitratireducens]KAA5541957.1 rhodanese-like domain-containing protein [Roseiconus nitratireducens]